MSQIHSASEILGQHGNDPRMGHNQTLPRLLFDQASKLGDAPFVRMKRFGIWQSMSWQSFSQDVLALAHALRARGLQKGDVVGVISENLPESYLIEYAAQAVGASVTCLYPDASSDELMYILNHCKAKILFAQDQEQVDKTLSITLLAEQLQTIVFLEGRGLWNYQDARLLEFHLLLEEGRNPSDQDQKFLAEIIQSANDTDIAALCYTSGTTGRPKGVVLTHRYLLDSAYRLVASFKIPPHIEYLSYISPAWAAEQITGLALALLAPAVVHFSEKASTVQSDLRELSPQFLLFTPRQWEMMSAEVAAAMLDAGPYRRRLVDWAFRAGAQGNWKSWLAEILVLRAIRDNLGLKRAIISLSAGSGMSAEVFHRFHAMGVPLRNLYGSTEYGLVSAHWGGAFDPKTLGRLLMVDPSVGEPLRARLSEDNELQLHGASGFGGYYLDETSTAQTFHEDGFFKTGDAILLNETSEFIFMDRIKDLRKLQNGKSFPPQFIENQLRSSQYIRDAIAIGDETRDFVTVLINIDAHLVGRYAERIGLAWSTFSDLSQMPQVHELISKTLTQINSVMELHAQALRFALFPKELDADDSELTRSRKLRREVIELRYAPLIGAMYSGEDSCPLNVTVKYQDGTEAHVRQDVRITSVRS